MVLRRRPIRRTMWDEEAGATPTGRAGTREDRDASVTVSKEAADPGSTAGSARIRTWDTGTGFMSASTAWTRAWRGSKSAWRSSMEVAE